ncbi:MAG: hypothetical protein K0Q55_3822 [Verrucomicrobia bacterium]|jgi:hypothetical protein|nr:hypothetical protein [Verrucomicrobiota bacterium]
MKRAYESIEGWMALGNLEEADLEFQKLPSRALSTKQGLWLWLRLSRALGRWQEVQAAASQLRALVPSATLPILHEAEALHHQSQTVQAVMLLASRAPDFAGEKWPLYLAYLKKYVAAAELTPEQTAMFQEIVHHSEANELSSGIANPVALVPLPA